MQHEIPQYIGVTGLTTPRNLLFVQMYLDELNWPAWLRYMNGVLVSRKTLLGRRADNPSQYRPLAEVRELLSDDPRFFNVIHFNSRDPRLYDQVVAVSNISTRIHGIQLNVSWPDKEEMKRLRHWREVERPDLRVILQISAAAYRALDEDPHQLVDCLTAYEGLTDYVLLDPSGGLGIRFEEELMLATLQALGESGLPFHIGLAGGLDASEVTCKISRFLEVYPQLCWDAQTQLRTGMAYKTDDLGRVIGRNPLPERVAMAEAKGDLSFDDWLLHSWDCLDIPKVHGFLEASVRRLMEATS